MGRRTPKFCVNITLTPGAISKLAHGSVKTNLEFRTDRKDAPLEIIIGEADAQVALNVLPKGTTFSSGKTYRLILSPRAYSTLAQETAQEISVRVGRFGLVYIRNEPVPPSAGVLFGGTYRDAHRKIAGTRV